MILSLISYVTLGSSLNMSLLPALKTCLIISHGNTQKKMCSVHCILVTVKPACEHFKILYYEKVRGLKYIPCKNSYLKPLIRNKSFAQNTVFYLFNTVF